MFFFVGHSWWVNGLRCVEVYGMALDGISLVTDGLKYDSGDFGVRLVTHGLVGSMASVSPVVSLDVSIPTIPKEPTKPLGSLNF